MAVLGAFTPVVANWFYPLYDVISVWLIIALTAFSFGAAYGLDRAPLHSSWDGGMLAAFIG
jgi:hypothetical protein